MRDPSSIVFWREVVSGGRASSYLVIECRTPPAHPAGTATAEDLAVALARTFFDGIADCSAGLFDAAYTEEPSADDRSPLVRDATLHPRAFPWLPLLRLGAPRLLRSRDHAFLVYPVAGGPMAGRPPSPPTGPGSPTPPGPPTRETPTVTGVPPGSGVWDLGALAFEVLRFEGTLSLSVLVCDYPPRLVGSGASLLRNGLYQLTQSPVHRLLVARFLRGAATKLMGTVEDPSRSLPS